MKRNTAKRTNSAVTDSIALTPPTRRCKKEPPVEIITQDELAHFLELKEQNKRYQEIRNQLVAALESGAWVEPGSMTIRLELQPRHIFSVKSLTPILGQDRVNELRVQVAPTMYRILLLDGKADMED